MLFKEKFILVILNSMIATFYLSLLVSKMRGGYFSLSKIYVEQLPIPTSALDKRYLLNTLTDLALYEKSNKLIHQSKTFENVINGTVFQLYFPDHMQEKQIDIADFVKADLNEVLQNRAFESLNTTEKEAVIEQLHRQWTHPDNEVRNRIKLFAVRSPDILKPILESQP